MKKIILSLLVGIALIVLSFSAHGDTNKTRFSWEFNLVTAKGKIVLEENTIFFIRNWSCQVWVDKGKTAESGTIICTKDEKSLGAYTKCDKNTSHNFDAVFLEKGIALTVGCSNE